MVGWARRVFDLVCADGRHAVVVVVKVAENRIFLLCSEQCHYKQNLGYRNRSFVNCKTGMCYIGVYRKTVSLSIQ